MRASWSFLLGVSKKPPAKEIEINLMIYGGCNIGKIYKFSRFILKSSEFLKKYQKYENTKNYIQKYKGENVGGTRQLIALCVEIMYFGTTYKSNEVKFDRANMLYKYITFFLGLISGGQSSPQFQIHHTTMNNK